MRFARTLSLVPLIAAGVALATTGDAAAQAKKKPSNEVYEIGPVIVTARPTRPSAIVELGKILPEIEIARIRQPFLAQIEEALNGEPF